jgi:two-component system LytT family response regulator
MPQIVFLDIEMPQYLGTQLLDFISPEEINFELVFTTAYNDHAIKAFEMNAIDYLLKPLQEDQLLRAVQKAARNLGHSDLESRLQHLQAGFESESFKKVGLPIAQGMIFLEIESIILCKAERMYTRVYSIAEGETLVSKPLKFFLDKLEDKPEFYRPHRSFLVNLQHVKRFSTQDGGYLEMSNGHITSISKDKREELQRLVSL